MHYDLHAITGNAFVPADYPRRYSVSLRNGMDLILRMILGLFCLGFLSATQSQYARSIWFDIVVVVLLVALLSVIKISRSTIILQLDCIEFYGLFFKKTIRRDQIKACRMQAIGSDYVFVLITNNAATNDICFSLPCEPDAAFRAWFSARSDLNADGETPLTEEMAASSKLWLIDIPVANRMEKLAQIKKIMRTVYLAGFLAWAGIVVFPDSDQLSIWILLALPWFALAMQRRNYYLATDDVPGLGYMDVVGVIFVTAAGLWFALVRNINVGLEMTRPSVIFGMALGVAMTVFWMRVSKWQDKNWPVVLFYAILASAYGFSAATLTNAMLDHDNFESYPVKVLARHQSSGSAIGSAFFSVTTWGKRFAVNDIAVSKALYDAKANGDTVCIHRYQGAYDIAWYSVAECKGGENPGLLAHNSKKIISFATEPWKRREAPTDKLLSLLQQGNYHDLDALLTQKQHEFEAGSSEAATFMDDAMDRFFGLDVPSASVEKHFDEWVTAYPKSYVAYLARAAFYLHRSGESRGVALMSETSDEQIQGMEHWDALADDDLQHSLALTAKPLLSHHYLIQEAMTEGRREQIEHNYAAGHAIAPDNIELRRLYMFTLTPRWSGYANYDAMNAYLAESAKSLGQADLDRLTNVIVEDQTAWKKDGDSKAFLNKALTFYTEAIARNDFARYRCDRAGIEIKLHRVSDAINDMNLALRNPQRSPARSMHCYNQTDWIAQFEPDAPGLIDLLDAYIIENPRDPTLYERRGWFFQQHDLNEKAYADYQAAAALGGTWAMLMQGRYVFNGWGGQKSDHEAGLALFRRSAQLGNDESRHCLVDALEFLGRSSEAEATRRQYGIR